MVVAEAEAGGKAHCLSPRQKTIARRALRAESVRTQLSDAVVARGAFERELIAEDQARRATLHPGERRLLLLRALFIRSEVVDESARLVCKILQRDILE